MIATPSLSSPLLLDQSTPLFPLSFFMMFLLAHFSLSREPKRKPKTYNSRCLLVGSLLRLQLLVDSANHYRKDNLAELST